MDDDRPPLRSAMKHSSRSTTPSPLSPPISPSVQPSPIPPLPQITPLSPRFPPQSPASTLDYSPLSVSTPSTSSMLPAISLSPTASTIVGPNPSQGYTPKVSFDTFENDAAPMFSFTLQVKSDGYERSPSTRVFLCASSPDESGRQALDWAIDSLAQDGDELIVFRGIDQDNLGKELSGLSTYSLR